jgi:hypothetical protein
LFLSVLRSFPFSLLFSPSRTPCFLSFSAKFPLPLPVFFLFFHPSQIFPPPFSFLCLSVFIGRGREGTLPCLVMV